MADAGRGGSGTSGSSPGSGSAGVAAASNNEGEEEVKEGQEVKPPGATKQKRKYTRNSGPNMKRLVFKEGDSVLLGGPVGPLPHGWQVTLKGSWKFETRHGAKRISHAREAGLKHILHPDAAEPSWKSGKVVVVAPGRSTIQLESGRLVCAWNHELNRPEICRLATSHPAGPPERLDEAHWPPAKALGRKPCGGCGRSCTDKEFGHAAKKGRKSCCYCRKGPGVAGSSNGGAILSSGDGQPSAAAVVGGRAGTGVAKVCSSGASSSLAPKAVRVVELRGEKAAVAAEAHEEEEEEKEEEEEEEEGKEDGASSIHQTKGRKRLRRNCSIGVASEVEEKARGTKCEESKQQARMFPRTSLTPVGRQSNRSIFSHVDVRTARIISMSGIASWSRLLSHRWLWKNAL